MKIPVYVYSSDAVLQAGVLGQLRGRPETEVIEGAELDSARVAVVACDTVDEETARTVKALHLGGSLRVVLVVSVLDDASLMAGVEAGCCGFIRRSEVTPERLTTVIVAAAAGDGSVPPDLLGRLLTHVSNAQANVLSPRGLHLSGLSDREIDVLKLVAAGFETSEIADRLCYSERTVKGVIHEVTTRFRLKNRAQAVAYAVRQGLI
jgi:DNA-binding NarL/FixJ family response regulator